MSPVLFCIYINELTKMFHDENEFEVGHLSVRADCPIRQHCLIRQHIACSGSMTLFNCVEFDNLTLNFSAGSKLSKAFSLLHIHVLQYLKLFDRTEKILTLEGRFLNNN